MSTHSDAATVIKHQLSWEHIEHLVDILVAELPTGYDAMLVITRGGMVPGCLISEKMDMRNILVAAVVTYTGMDVSNEIPTFLQFPSDPLLTGQRILVVDDVWDSGRTIMAVKERLRVVNCVFDVAVLHYKPARSRYADIPDYYAESTDGWIVYPWDPAKER